MILLDTNVLSELMRPQPADAVVTWLDSQPMEQVWISAITQAEILLGLALMPAGKRQQALSKAAMAMFEKDFGGRCLPFDARCTPAYAAIVSRRIQKGRPVSTEDAQIAAIALTYDLHLATRNTKDFEEIDGLQLLNPWKAER
ncbi:type II toxin-antitoxin system VapC family toxin [Candidatus Parcubacteria bacterium]|nr:MAG: type II toxin-antitoxin system VapC family toxin [Candidatus Parcubacteria bacterium]